MAAGAEHEPAIRRCLATGERAPKRSLLRFVVSPAGDLVFDAGQRLPGRGHYLAPTPEAFANKRLAGLFARSAKQPIAVPGDLAERVRAGLEQRALAELGLAQKAGLVVSGYEKVRERLKAKDSPVFALLEASDGAPGGRAKLAKLAEAASPGFRRIECFTAEQIGHALGRLPQVHVALATHDIVERFAASCERLSALKAVDSRST